MIDPLVEPTKHRLLSLSLRAVSGDAAATLELLNCLVEETGQITLAGDMEEWEAGGLWIAQDLDGRREVWKPLSHALARLALRLLHDRGVMRCPRRY